MVRRGNRAGPVVNNTSSSSSGSNQHRWNRSRPNSANSGELKGVKSSDSTRSSPNASSQSTSSSPQAAKKGGVRGSRSASYWRGGSGGSSNGSAGGGRSTVPRDPKFAITNEDFPALPIVRGGPQSTPNKNRGPGRQNGSAVKLREAITDDSGHSSSSRGHTPPFQEPLVHVKLDKRIQKTLGADQGIKKKTPTKDRVPRGNTVKLMRSVPSPLGTAASPKKKSINAANSGSAATPSFMKLSKLGQKMPERRGGTRQSNHSLSPTDSSTSPISEGKENREEHVETPTPLADTTITAESVELKETTAKPPSPVNPLNIVVGKGGDLSNIPESMLLDQFGMAAMLPILDVVKNLKANPPPPEASQRTKEQKLHVDMTTLCIGMDLSTLHVPIKTSETSTKTVWDSFAGPFGQEPLPPTSIGLSPNIVPSVYYTARTLRGTFDMTMNVPDKFGVHELFYLFYNIPKELWQVNAARELMWRGWRYNKREMLWIHKKLGEQDDYSLTVTPPHNPLTQIGANPDEIITGNFEIYDAEKDRITSREMCIRRSDLETPFFEMRAPDTYQMVLNRVFSKEMLWGGPREDYIKPNPLIGFPGMQAKQNGQSNKPSNLNIPNGVPPVPQQQQPPQPPQPQQQPIAQQQQNQSSNPVRRLLSFADSPEATPNFETPFGQLPPPSTAEEAYRHQMYALIVQKMQQSQMLHHQQQLQQQQNQQQKQQIGAVMSQSSSSHSQP